MCAQMHKTIKEKSKDHIHHQHPSTPPPPSPLASRPACAVQFKQKQRGAVDPCKLSSPDWPFHIDPSRDIRLHQWPFCKTAGTDCKRYWLRWKMPPAQEKCWPIEMQHKPATMYLRPDPTDCLLYTNDQDRLERCWMIAGRNRWNERWQPACWSKMRLDILPTIPMQITLTVHRKRKRRWRQNYVPGDRKKQEEKNTAKKVRLKQ